MKHCFKSLFLVLVVTANASVASLEIKYTAEKTTHDKKSNTVELIGNAKVTRGGKTMTGQKIRLNLNTRIAEAIGEAQLTANNLTTDFSLTNSTAKLKDCRDKTIGHNESCRTIDETHE